MLAHHGSLYTLNALLISISFIMAGCGGQPDFIPAATGMTLHVMGQVRTVEDGRVRLNLATGEVFVVEFAVEFIDSVVAKGKTEPVKIYKLLEVEKINCRNSAFMVNSTQCVLRH